MPAAPAPPRPFTWIGVVRCLLCLAATAVCLAGAAAIVLMLRIGPVIATIDAEAGRGVHEGDVLAVPLVAAALLLLTAGLRPVLARST